MKRKTWVLTGAAVLVAVTATGGGVVVSGAKQAAPAAQEPKVLDTLDRAADIGVAGAHALLPIVIAAAA